MDEDTVLIRINGTDITSYLKAPEGFKVDPNELFKDSGRSMDGNLLATSLGYFPKIELKFRSLSSDEMETILGLLMNTFFTVAFWYEKSGSIKSGTFYRGDFGYTVYSKALGRYTAFDVNLIAKNKISL